MIIHFIILENIQKCKDIFPNNSALLVDVSEKGVYNYSHILSVFSKGVFMKADNRKQTLLFEQIIDIASLFFRTYRVPMISSILFGMLAHGFVFTNKYINHDEIYNLFGKGATVDSGRWGLGALDSILPNYSMSWIYGILTVFLIAVSVSLIIHIFSVESRILQALLSGAVVVFPVWTSTFSFMFTSSSYGIAFLMAVLSVLLLRKPNIFFRLCGLGCAIFSVAIYQAYIAIVASLLVLTLIQGLLTGDNLLRVFVKGLFYVGFLILTLGFYYLATQAILILKDVAFNTYASERNSFEISSLPRNISLAYSHFFCAFKTGEYALFPTSFTQWLHIFCFAACGIMLCVLFCVKRMKLSRILFILALAAVFPLAVNCMYLFTLEEAIHTLVLCGTMVVYVPLVVIADHCISQIPTEKCLDWLRHIALNILFITLSAIIICNTYFANEAYLASHLQYENAYAFYTSLLSDIRMHPEFDENTKLAVIGRWDYPDYFSRKFDFTYHLFGYQNSSPAEYSMDRFLEYYVGLSIPFASTGKTKRIENSEEFAQMPVYPYYGSIQMLDNTLVVKLS